MILIFGDELPTVFYKSSEDNLEANEKIIKNIIKQFNPAQSVDWPVRHYIAQHRISSEGNLI